MTRKSPGRLFLLAAAGLALAACGRPPEARPGDPPPRAVRVARAELRPMERVVQVTGALSVDEQAMVAAQVAGQIERTFVDVGERVAAGEELAAIDTTAYAALARQAAANLSKAEAAADNAQRTLERVQRLRQEEIASTSDLDQATADAARTQADVRGAEAADAIARLNLERSHVKAPFTGSVAQRSATVGDYVAVGTPIVRLLKTDRLRLRLDVPERESGAVRLGQSVRVQVEGDATVHSSTIARIAPAIRESDRMLAVEADLERAPELRPGAFARARIVVREQEPGLSVPAEALTGFAGLEKVVVVRDGQAVETTVATGRRGDDWVEIVSGLEAGQVVVLDPAGIRTGQKLAVDASVVDTR